MDPIKVQGEWKEEQVGRKHLIVITSIPYGVNTNHLRIPGALACSVTPTTLLSVLTDLVDSLQRQVELFA